MTTVSWQIQSIDETICRNIESLVDQRALLSQNVLSQLRNLAEGVAVLLHTGSPGAEFNYAAIEPGLAFVRTKASFNFLGKFHKLLQKSASHYTLDGDASERLMLKYYEYLYRVRSLLQEKCGIAVLANLEAFPVDLDPSLREYHEKIAARIEAARSGRSDRGGRDRYYIHKTRPFFWFGRVYYEVTFYRAINKVNKFDRIIAFTDIDMTDKYAAMLALQRDSIEVLGQTMPITIIREWEVSIRPCEFNNFARLLGISLDVRTNSTEYRHLMHGLTASSGTQAVERWLDETSRGIDDQVKRDALKLLFAQSRVALIYGAAGTGKSTMVDHVANYFNDKKKLFLAHTHPATDNLKRRVTAQNSDFRTISRQTYRTATDPEYDLLVIDECSTVSNADLIKVLEKTSFKLLVLVGDVYQIESIQFGNWFGIIRSFIPSSSVFELTTPFRTKNQSLLAFWNKIRNIDDDIAEVIAHNGYSTVLDKTLFETQGRDEIILCLNYDGLYGINNINRFLQSSNPGAATTWRESTYKIGDPVLFYETERFRPVIYNNLKGWIVGIDPAPGRIQFDIELDRPLSEFDVDSDELEWMGDSTVRFSVYDYDTSDEDDDSLNTTVPFQVAYAVSIHKAQGLEYDSVKIVITDANEDDITHSIFYTAVTRARERLRIFWTPETQQRVLQRLRHGANTKDVALLASRRGLRPVNG